LPKKIPGLIIKILLPAALLALSVFYGFYEHWAFVLIFYFLLVRLYKIVLADKLKDFHLPPLFINYLLFLVLFAISLTWSKNLNLSLIYFFLFLSGLLFWIVSYNSKRDLKRFDLLIILLGIVYGGIALFNLMSGDPTKAMPLSLVRYSVEALHHHHIGDLWAPILVVSALVFIKTNKALYLLLLPIGVYFLFLSLSRSAYVALVAGSIYVLWQLKMKRKYKYIFASLIAVSILLFFYAGTQKNTLPAHGGYLLQGLAGAASNPFGIGVGNFRLLTQETGFALFGLEGVTASAHNIVLEIVAGMGILSLSFILWLVAVLIAFAKDKSKDGIVFRVVFVTLTVNFFFDYTYLIPTMIWLWFVSLGLGQKNLKKVNI